MSTTSAIWLVAEREIASKLRSKAFLISTGILLLIALAALPQIDLPRTRALAASLGYGPIAGFLHGVWPPLYRQMRLAVIDPLTGLYNRRYALPRLAEIAQQAVAGGRHFAVFVVDLDHFKTVNDRHGHSAGDAVLSEIARRLRKRHGF